MTAPIPAGHEGLIPHLVCDPCADAIEFYKQAFGAEEVRRAPGPDGKRLMHAEIRIGGKPVFLVDDFP
jgi:PhnB protein